MAWKRFIALVVLSSLLPGTVLAGPILGDGSFWQRREPEGYSRLHYWLPGYYRWRAYLHPVNVPFPVQQPSTTEISAPGNLPTPSEQQPMPPAPGNLNTPPMPNAVKPQIRDQ